MGTCDCNKYEGNDGNDTDADTQEDASQANDGSIQTVED
jgi:hypothetical protein